MGPTISSSREGQGVSAPTNTAGPTLEPRTSRESEEAEEHRAVPAVPLDQWNAITSR